jgi:folate-binding Fe-S cluster repair protein YgfZ
MYIFRSKVSIVEAELSAIGLSGKDAQTLLASLPQQKMETSTVENGIAIKLSDTRFEIVSDHENLMKIRENLENRAQ